jgi:hypothetical protein
VNTQPKEFLCVLCSTPVNLTTDLNTDEKGNAVHQQCYADQLTGKRSRFRVWVMSPIYRTAARLGAGI